MRFRRSLSAIAFFAVAWLFLAGFFLMEFWPSSPHSPRQWLLVILIGPPVYLLGEAFFGWVFSEKHGRAISKDAFSVERIAFGVVVAILCLGLALLVSWLQGKL